MFKKMGARTAGAPRVPLLLTVVSLYDLSSWPLHGTQASYMVVKAPTGGITKKPAETEWFLASEVESVNGFATCFKTTRPTEHNAGLFL